MSTPLSEIMFNDRGFAFDPISGETFQLNTTGLRIAQLLREGLGHEIALAKMVEEFEVDDAAARRDFDEFLVAVAQVGWTQ